MSAVARADMLHSPSLYKLAVALGPYTIPSGYDPMLGTKRVRTALVDERRDEEERRLNASKLIQRVWRGHRTRMLLANGKILQSNIPHLEQKHEVSFDDSEFFDYDVFNEDLSGDFEFLFSDPPAGLGDGLQPPSATIGTYFPSDAPSASEYANQGQPAYPSAADIQESHSPVLPANEQQFIAPAILPGPVLGSHTSPKLGKS